MRYHPRHIEARLQRLFRSFPVTVVMGARQSGKSTLAAHALQARPVTPGPGAPPTEPGAVRTFVFDPVTDVGNARRDPELFLRLNPPPLLLDEVQHAPELLPVLKRLVDETGANGQYLLTGSQQLQVLDTVKETLAGRAILLDLYPMTRGELAADLRGGLLPSLFGDPPATDAFELIQRLGTQGPPSLPAGNLYERIFRGGYPRLLTIGTADLTAWFESYVRTYVERDARAVRDVSHLHDFTRFLRLAAALTGRELNSSQLGREIGVTPKTARAWMETLRASYMVTLVEAYSGNAIKRVSGRPKIHLTDTGLASHLLGISSPSALLHQPTIGQLFESYVVNEILRGIHGMDARPHLWHWRTSAGAEVDLLLERDGRFYPIEIKLASRPSRKDLRGLASFVETYPRLPLGPRIIVHGGVDLFLVDEQTAAVPVDWV